MSVKFILGILVVSSDSGLPQLSTKKLFPSSSDGTTFVRLLSAGALGAAGASRMTFLRRHPLSRETGGPGRYTKTGHGLLESRLRACNSPTESATAGHVSDCAFQH